MAKQRLQHYLGRTWGKVIGLDNEEVLLRSVTGAPCCPCCLRLRWGPCICRLRPAPPRLELGACALCVGGSPPLPSSHMGRETHGYPCYHLAKSRSGFRISKILAGMSPWLSRSLVPSGPEQYQGEHGNDNVVLLKEEVFKRGAACRHISVSRTRLIRQVISQLSNLRNHSY